MGNEFRISACICTYNRDEFLYAALESLAVQSLSASRYEVILVDNNSTDQTPQLGQKFKQEYPNINFNYIKETKQGLSHARNRAINEANGDLITFIDDDAIASEQYLNSLVDFFDEYTQVKAAGGKILPYFYPQRERPDWMSHYLLGLISCLDLGDEVKPFPKYPLGCNMIFRRSVFDEVGYFDTRLGRTSSNLMGSEEKDIFIRIKKAGMPVYYVPDALVYHTIPEERVTEPYLRQLSAGIGKSEKIMYFNSRMTGRLNIIIKQTVKTVGTAIIALSYYLKGEAPKGRMLFWYRVWFLNGFFQSQPTNA